MCPQITQLLHAAAARTNADESRSKLFFRVIRRLSLRSRSRNASSCYRVWDAGCREVEPPSSCCRGILRALGESCCARRRRDSARLFVRQPPDHALFVGVLSAIGLRPAALLRRSSSSVPAPPRIQLRSATPARFPASRTRVTFETHPARRLVRVCRVVERTV